MIVKRIFAERPLIKKLVHDKKTHPICQVEKLRSRWIMRRSNGVDTELSEFVQPVFPHRQGHSRTESTAVVMQAGSFDLQVFAVKPKARVGIEMVLANSKAYGVIVGEVSIAGCCNGGAVECRMC